MTSEQFQRVKTLYDALEPLPPAERARALAGGDTDTEDPTVRAEVAALFGIDGAGAHDRLADMTRQLGAVAPAALRAAVAAALLPAEQAAGASAAVSEMVGRRVGPYDLVRVLGRGGMGVVYLGQDTRLGRAAALKAVLPGGGGDGVLVERLRREARILASLSHPNLATVYGLEESHGTLFLAMEHVEGKSLAQRLSRGAALPIGDALLCAEQVAAGLEAAHDAGVIHRDLKPGNVMFAADGSAKVLDFGLARESRKGDAGAPDQTWSEALTREGSFMGTPAYMSPEQARAEPVDRRCDVFSLGSVLYRCLAGRPAFDGTTLDELIEAIATRDPDWSALPPRLPAGVLAALKRCLAKDPAERYRHVGDLRMDLRDARLARAWERRDATPGRAAALRRWLPWAVAACAVIAAVTWRLGSPDRAPTATAPAPPAAPVHRFDVTFPADAVQGDLERVQLALSPDGREWVVACKTPAGGQALWARAHRDGAWRRVERSDGGHRPVFSPDGQWVTFYRDGHLFKHRTAGGGDPIRLAATTNWYGADWTADGALVFCTAWGTPLQFLGPAEAKPRPCTKIDAARGDVSHIGPAVVPGGRWLLYNAWPGGEVTDIYAAELAAGAPGEPHVVVANASTPKFASTPRGEYLLFERGSIIFAAPFDRATARVTGPETAVAEGVLNDGTRFAAYFDVAADGTLAWIPGASFAEESRLAYVNADGTTTPVNDDRMSFCEPSFSPAGGRMAVLVKGKVYRALVYDLASQTREFLVTGGDTLSHAMSPDGQTLACTVNRDGGYGVDLISLADGRRIGRIVEPAADYMSDLSWSADGKVITFSMTARQGVPNDIWIVDARAGATPRPLVSTAGADTKPAICPTANWVAYASDVSGRAEIYLVSYPDGTTTRQITFGGGMRPAWSPDGRTLYFVGPKGLTSVKVTPGGAVAGQPQIVYDKPFGQSDPIAREYAVATDGRILIVEPSERRPTVSHIKVITNWHRLLP